MDSAAMPFFCRQRRPPSAPRARLQPWQLHAHAADAEGSAVVVADQSAREADQDRRQGCQPRPLRRLPIGRCLGVAADVCGYPDADRPAAGATRTSMTGLCGQKSRTTMEVRLDEGKATSSGAPQGQATMAFTAQGSRRASDLLPRRPERAEIAPQPREAGECRSR
jgi:hypothetical protein